MKNIFKKHARKTSNFTLLEMYCINMYILLEIVNENLVLKVLIHYMELQVNKTSPLIEITRKP